MLNLKTLISSLANSSKVLSSIGQAEQSALQETVLGVCAMRLIDGGEAVVLSDDYLSSVKKEKQSSKQIKSYFSKNDIKIGLSESCERFVVQFYVDSKEAMEGAPVFLHNYVSEDMFPILFGFCVELIEIEKLNRGEQFLALPYFPLISLNAEYPEPTIGFVGEENRKKAVQNPSEATQDAMSNLHIYMPLLAALPMYGEESYV